jgi:hypothetical protein
MKPKVDKNKKNKKFFTYILDTMVIDMVKKPSHASVPLTPPSFPVG